MPLDVDEKLRSTIEELEQEFALLIENIPVASFLDPALQDARIKRKNTSPLIILQSHARPDWQKRKGAKIEKLEVKHTDTSKVCFGNFLLLVPCNLCSGWALKS